MGPLAVLQWPAAPRRQGDRVGPLLLQCMSPVVALFGPDTLAQRCLVIGVKRTCRIRPETSVFDPNRTWPNSTRTCLLVTSHNFRRFLGTCHRYRCSVIAEVRKRPTSPVPNECVDLKQVNRRNVSSRSSFWFVNSNLEKSHGYGSKRARQSYRQRQG